MTDRNRLIWWVVGTAALAVAALVAVAVVVFPRDADRDEARQVAGEDAVSNPPAPSAPAPNAATNSGGPPISSGSGTLGRSPSGPETGGRSPSGEPAPRPPANAQHPTPATTGVPPGTKLKTLPVNDGAYFVKEDGAVLDGVHIPGDLLITAHNVIIKNSQIDGGLVDEYSGRFYSFTISDSTVGPERGCLTSAGIGEADFTARRVHVRGHGDGFRASGNNVHISDSYVDLCSNPGDHSDGIQTYLTGRGLVLHNTTIDQRGVPDMNAPIFIVDEQAADVTVTGNLVMGGTYSIQVRNAKGRVVVRDNRLVDKSWVYGPVDSDCDTIDWSGNSLVTIDDNYRITSTVAKLPC